MPNENPHAVIVKTRSFKRPFRVKYYGSNGEVISVSQPLTTLWNCRKNIVAMINFVIASPEDLTFVNKKMEVWDRTKKKESRFFLTEYNEICR